MTTLREAAQQALEALESKRFTSCGWRTDCDKAITALKAALAEPVEPVAWRYELATTIHENEYGGWAQLITPCKPNVPEGSIRNLTPLYIAPPQRKPLSEAKIKKLLIESAGMTIQFNDVDLRFARAIERAHGIGEQP